MRIVLLPLALVAALVPGAAPADLTVLPFRCDGAGGTPMAMENSYIAATGRGACWFHTGHHTYDLRSRYELHAIQGWVVSVEQAFSPSTEPNRLREVVLEGSTDGVAWSTFGLIDYEDRQVVPFSFAWDHHRPAARYLRIREPLSAAQGLSGFLDASGFDVTVAPLGGPEPDRPKASYACATDVMEGPFALEHPCWFGGINRYDSPSVFHTYPIGPSSLAAVSGSATFLPWRTDDYFFDDQSPTSLEAEVQVSADAVAWTTLGRIDGLYGEPIAFSFAGLGGTPAEFVRIVAEYHRGMFRPPTSNWPPLKHARGFLVDSRVDVARAP